MSGSPGASPVAVIPGSPLASSLALAARDTAPSSARRHTRRVLAEWKLGQLADSAELLVSEIVTNAIKYAGSGQAATLDPARLPGISLRLRCSAGRLIIEIVDPDPRPPVLADPDDEAESGRGLMIVQLLSRDWGFYYLPQGGKVVYCILAITSEA